MKTAFLFLFLIAVNTYAQFDSLIFTKHLYQDDFNLKSIYPLGNQNKDGFDDIMIYDCNTERGYIFFGGSPMDTVPVNSSRFFDSVNTGGSIAVIDINNDGINDIVAGSIILTDTGYFHIGPIRIYYGGNVIDTLPDLTFNPPPGSKGALFQALRDFNEDGRSKLVMYDANLPYSQKQYGTFYFYNTESQFDTIPHYIIMGDSVNLIRYGQITSSGDINGDGKTDFTILGSVGQGSNYQPFRSFYLGNANFNLTPAVTYYRDEHTFDVGSMRIINDINGDHKDDILISDYGFYPWYYRFAILHGSFPIDTIPDVGLNTQNLGLGETYSLGDVNGDGYNDFFAKDGASYPDIRLWIGGPNMPYTTDDQANKTWYGTSDGFGRILSNVGDVDGDGVNDMAIGEIPYWEPHCKMSTIYIFKGDTSVIGDTIPAVVNRKENLLKDFHLYDPYPNPFNPTTVIAYQLQVTGMVKITVYDILGKEIATLIDEYQKAGEHKVEFNADKYGLSSGVYFYRLITSNGYDAVKKLILLK